jgi:hypothetical protein
LIRMRMQPQCDMVTISAGQHDDARGAGVHPLPPPDRPLVLQDPPLHARLGRRV